MLYGAMDPSARKISVARFRAKLCQYMVVTDVAARGVDIPLLENVLLLLLYCCFTAALLLLYCCFTDVAARGVDIPLLENVLLLYCCFTAALLLLYCCFTTALLLLYGRSR
jgi:superfamily II DNA/RNA helicase